MIMGKEEPYVSVARHAIGLDNKNPYIRHGRKFYKPYRNYFATAPQFDDYEIWEVLEAVGYAKSIKSERGVVFWLTREGLDWLGNKLGIRIHEEED